MLVGRHLALVTGSTLRTTLQVILITTAFRMTVQTIPHPPHTHTHTHTHTHSTHTHTPHTHTTPTSHTHTHTHAELLNDTVPEIQRSSLSSVILQLLALGISNIVEFDFMDPPSEESLVRALEQLYLLGAIETDSSEEGVKLTALGLKMAQFPLEPSLAKTLLSAGEHGCGVEIVNIVSMLSVDSVLFTPQDKRERALESRRKFVSPDGDHLMLLKIYRAFKSVKGNKVSQQHKAIYLIKLCD